MRLGRLYFGAQAAAGGAWWVSVALVPAVKRATLGGLDPIWVAAVDIPLFVIASAVAGRGVRVAAWIATVWTVVVAIALAVYAAVTGLAGIGVLVMVAAAGGSVLALCLLTLGRVPTQWIIAGPFGFRSAPLRATSRHVVRTFAQALVFQGLALGVVPVVIWWLERRWQLAVTFPAGVGTLGVVIFVLATAFAFWSAATLSTRGDGTPLPSEMPRRLVVAGAYRFVRNPMAVAGIAQGVAVGFMLSSWLVVAYALIGSVIWNYAIRPHEEADLAARFGVDYVRYAERVWCWVPRIPLRP